jgi:hypothetical protein
VVAVTTVTGEFSGHDKGTLLDEITVAGMGFTGPLADEPEEDEDDEMATEAILLFFFRSRKFLCRT